MNEICVNEKKIDRIEFIDKSEKDKVLGVLKCCGAQECDNGYAFRIKYQEDAVKE